MLGVAYLKGEVIPRDDQQAEFHLKKSIEMGSAYGKRYYIVLMALVHLASVHYCVGHEKHVPSTTGIIQF
jgi:TPR repeat protein